MQWEYFKNNICKDRPVAAAVINGKRILYVYENRDSYYTQPCSQYLKSAYITYHNARKMNTEEEENQKESIDVLYASLVHACEYFAGNYYEQKSEIMTELGFHWIKN